MAIFTVSCKQKSSAESDSVDTYALLDYMSEFVRYVNQPVKSKKDIEQTDFIYFLFDLSLWKNKTQYESIVYIDSFGYDMRTQQHTVKADTLIEYMDNYFGIGEEYFDKYKNSDYEYKSPHDFYDPETDSYKFITINTYLWAANYSISKTDTKIYINKNDITVKTMYLYDYYTNSAADDIRNSVDYKFTAHQKDGETYYRLDSVDIYEDDRNKNKDVVLSVDRTDYIAPWYTVERNGKIEYYPPSPFIPAKIHSWDVSVSSYEGIWLSGVKDNTAYFMFAYKGIFDVYLYDVSKKTGHFMSGTSGEDFSVYYKKEIEYLNNNSDEYSKYAYFNYYIVSMPPKSDFALMRRSKQKSESMAGEYYMRNLKTGKETYICDSYDREYIISYMEEYYEWIDENHLRISVFLEDSNPSYDVIYDGDIWVTTLLQEN